MGDGERHKSDLFVSVAVTLDGEDRHRFVSVVPALALHLKKFYDDYEIVVIDSSGDEIVEKNFVPLLATVESVRYLKLAGRANEEIAWAASLDHSIGDVIVFFDYQNDPLDAIDSIVGIATDGSEAIVGIAKDKTTLLYRLIRPIINIALSAIDYKLPRNATGLWCLSRKAANAVIASGRFHQQLYTRIYKSGYGVNAFEYERLSDSRRVKTLPDALGRSIRQMVFNSTRPLRWMTILGATGSLLAFLFSGYSVTSKLLNENILEGWASLVLITSLFFMMIFIILAFFGEYLGRLLDELGNRQDYQVAMEQCSNVMLNEERYNVSSN